MQALWTACQKAWMPERRRCSRTSLSGLGCVQPEGHEEQGEGCESGAEWWCVSGCGSRRRKRRDPFTLLEANHSFYQELEVSGESARAPAFELPLVCDAAPASGQDLFAETWGGLVCRVFILSSRDEFLMRMSEGDAAAWGGGLEVEGCAFPEKLAALVLPISSPPPASVLAVGPAETPDAPSVANGTHARTNARPHANAHVGAGEGEGKVGPGKGRGNKVRGKGGDGAGADGGAEAARGAAVLSTEAWPSLAPSNTVQTSSSKWGKGTTNEAAGEEGGGRGKNKGAGERNRMRPLNPLEDALEAMVLATKESEKSEKSDAADDRPREQVLSQVQMLVWMRL